MGLAEVTHHGEDQESTGPRAGGQAGKHGYEDGSTPTEVGVHSPQGPSSPHTSLPILPRHEPAGSNHRGEEPCRADTPTLPLNHTLGVTGGYDPLPP